MRAMNSPLALIIIDMQTCAFDGRLCPPIDQSTKLLENIATLAAKARAYEIPLIYLQHRALEGPLFAEGTAGWKIHEVLAPQAVDTIVSKHLSNGFEDTKLDDELKRMEISTLVTCGIQSEFCVRNTSFGALDRGYSVSVAADGHGTLPTNTQSAAEIVAEQNKLLKERGASVLNTGDLVESFARFQGKSSPR